MTLNLVPRIGTYHNPVLGHNYPGRYLRFKLMTLSLSYREEDTNPTHRPANAKIVIETISKNGSGAVILYSRKSVHPKGGARLMSGEYVVDLWFSSWRR